MYRLLVIEDDPRIGGLIKDYFEREGFSVVVEDDGIEGYSTFKASQFDLVILDIMLPGMDGFSIANRIRKGFDTPIIMVTARGNVEDQLLGYKCLVDDYVTKPFNPDILVAKAKSILQRLHRFTNNEKEDIFELNDFKVNFHSRQVTIEGVDIILEPKQFDILQYLIQNKNKVLSRNEILDKIWGFDYYGSDRVVDTQIRKLRKSLGHKSYLIKTTFSVGYSFEEK